MSHIDPFDIHELVTPISNDWPREVTPIPVRELERLKLKAELREEMDVRFDKVDERFDKLEDKQDENFQALLSHVTRKSVMETLVANTKVMVIMAIILLVLAVGYTQAAVDIAAPGFDVEVNAPLEHP